MTYFNLEYDNLLEGWKNNNSSGAAYTTQNSDGVVKSQGLEFTSSWKVFQNFRILELIILILLPMMALKPMTQIETKVTQTIKWLESQET